MADQQSTSHLEALVQEQVAEQVAPLQDQLSNIVALLQARQETAGGLDGGVPHGEDLEGIRTVFPTVGGEQDGGEQQASQPSPAASKQANSLGVQQSPLGAATKFGDNLPPVPPKISGRIVRGEFVAMHELLPECLADTAEANKPAAKARAKKRIQDLNTWLQCFARYVGVLGPAKPACVPQMMSYMVTIIRASQEYEGAAWAVYDDAYRRQAAAAGHWQWSEVNSSLYSMCFTGKAKQAGRCDRCLSAAHKSEDCVLPGEEDPDIAKRLKTIETALLALIQPGTSSTQRSLPTEVCRKYNWTECRYRACKYAHRCAACRGSHPAAQCTTRAPQSGQGANASPLGPMRRTPQQRVPPQSTPY